MLSDRTQPGNAVEHTHSSQVSVRLVESILCRFSPIGETSPSTSLLNIPFSSSYRWNCNCLLVSRIWFQKMIDAEDHQSGKRRSCLYVEWSNGRRKCSRDESTVWIGTEGSPHRLGLERPDPRGSRGCQVSRGLRNGQHQDQELPGIYSRVDHERTSRFGRWKLASCPSCFWVTTRKEMLWQQQRNGARRRCWTRESAVLRPAISRMPCGTGLSGRKRPCKLLPISIRCSVPACTLPRTQSEIFCSLGRPAQAKRASWKPLPRFCSEIAVR